MQTDEDTGVVLIVDDVPENLSLLCDALDEAGYIVSVATDGRAALQRLHHVRPDAILLDAVMPGWDGFETCRRLKADGRWCDIPVLFMTGLTETEHVVQGFASGGIDYVTKPINPDEVIARVAAHISTARRLGQAREISDLSGHAFAVAHADGTLAWCSPRAAEWLARHSAVDECVLKGSAAAWLRECVELGSQRIFHGRHLDAELCVHFLGMAQPCENGQAEYALMLEEKHQSASCASLHSYSLTQREVEVLTWLAKGKTNRDIADILGMSPRTVNKHLEHIYVKLGVETRTAAASIAREKLATAAA